jgi:diacylglycerol kinase (ATP)
MKGTPMKAKKIHVIINPVSAAGKTGRRQEHILAAVEKYLGKKISFYVTRKPLDACESARQAVLEGNDLIVAVGGDGTIQEVVNGILSVAARDNPSAELGILNCGTGHGFAQSLRLPDTLEEQLQFLSNGSSRSVDVCKILYTGNDGNPSSRFYVNECQIGIGSEVVRSVTASDKKLGGRLAFGFKTLCLLLRHPSQPIRVAIDGGPEIASRLIGVMAANGDYAGGGMNLAPKARFNDGKLDLLLIREQPLALRLWNFGRIYSGKHIGSSKIDYYQAARVVLSSDETVSVGADGEVLGRLPCGIEVVPSALRVKAKLG